MTGWPLRSCASASPRENRYHDSHHLVAPLCRAVDCEADMSIFGAKLELTGLDVIYGRGRSTIVEVTKAVTVAVMHGGVEAKVICKRAHQLLEAHALLSGKSAEDMGIKWNDTEEVYELPNGSAIRVTVEAKSC